MKIIIVSTILSCIYKCKRILTTSIKKKIIFVLLVVGLLGACTSPTTMLGPAYTFSSTGNIFQTGLSYGSSELIKRNTGKTPMENIKQAIEDSNKNIQKKTLESEDFFVLVENQIKKTNGILNLSTQ